MGGGKPRVIRKLSISAGQVTCSLTVPRFLANKPHYIRYPNTLLPSHIPSVYLSLRKPSIDCASESMSILSDAICEIRT